MLNKEAVEALNIGTSEAIQAAHTSLVEEGPASHLAALPNNFILHDLEKFMPVRRRARGIMQTQVIPDFAGYIQKNKEEGAAVFIDLDAMKATAVLNLGDPDAPGHADNKAVYAAKQTAAYKALLAVANGMPQSQVKIAEFLEDWVLNLNCMHDGELVTTPKAIAAVRDISIDALRKQGNTEGQLSASRTTFEEVKASSKEQIPTLIEFWCEPYAGLTKRTFHARLGIQTGGDKPTLILRIVKQEEHQEQMGKELAGLIDVAMAHAKTDAGGGLQVPVILGGYSASN